MLFAVRSRKVRSLTAVLACLSLGSLLAFTGCGSSSSDGTSTSADSTAATGGSEGHQFPELRVAWSAIDHLDPALSYGGGFTVAYGVYASLVEYRHANGPAGTELVPVLAEAMPKISADNRTYTFTLRQGLKYSDGKPIVASDIANGIERDFEVNSPGVGFYGNIEGAAAFERDPGHGHISGIRTDDQARTISFTLVKPRGDFLSVLALPFAAPVPAGTPARDQSSSPIPASGQYRIVSYDPGRGFELERNKFYTPVPGVPAGNPHLVKATIVSDETQALQMAISDEVDWDQAEIPSDRIAELQEKYPSQLRAYEQSNTEMFFMNERLAPFDDVRARKAVEYAIDREAFVKFAGGLAKTTQNILPPTYPSYRQIDYYSHDPAKAKQLIAAAGATGAKVRVLGDSDNEFSRSSVTYLASVLEEIGLEPEIKLLSDSVYFDSEGDPSTKANIGWTPWFQDYPHPLDWFGVMVDGETIQESAGNTNYSFADIPALNAKIHQLEKEPVLTPEVNEAWAEVDREAVVDYAVYAPYVNLLGATFFGPQVNTECETQLAVFRFDWTAACLKE